MPKYKEEDLRYFGESELIEIILKLQEKLKLKKAKK